MHIHMNHTLFFSHINIYVIYVNGLLVKAINIKISINKIISFQKLVNLVFPTEGVCFNLFAFKGDVIILTIALTQHLCRSQLQKYVQNFNSVL